MWHVRGKGDVHVGFWWGNPREREHLEDLRLYGRLMFKWIFKKSVSGVDWIDLAQDSDTWQVHVNGVMKFHVPYKARNLLTN
jgi:hypothetical protein